jgi:hypothetical protein
MVKRKHAPAKMPLVAYQNDRFLESGEARPLRILSEYLAPAARLRRTGVRHTVVFFGSARIRPREEAQARLQELEARSKQGGPEVNEAALERALADVRMSRYYEEAREISRLLTAWALSLQPDSRYLIVCSGGGPGIMEAANRGASEAGGKSIGMNIKLPLEQRPNPYISPELSFLFRYFFMRKLWFAQPARAIIAFPGGFGTMDELFEILTLQQTRKMHQRVTIMLYGSDYWKNAINFDYFVQAGTVSEADLKLIRYADTPKEAVEILQAALTRLLTLKPAGKNVFF